MSGVVKIDRAFCVEIDFGDRDPGGTTDGLSLHLDSDPYDITPEEAREIAQALECAADEWEAAQPAAGAESERPLTRIKPSEIQQAQRLRPGEPPIRLWHGRNLEPVEDLEADVYEQRLLDALAGVPATGPERVPEAVRRGYLGVRQG